MGRPDSPAGILRRSVVDAIRHHALLRPELVAVAGERGLVPLFDEWRLEVTSASETVPFHMLFGPSKDRPRAGVVVTAADFPRLLMIDFGSWPAPDGFAERFVDVLRVDERVSRSTDAGTFLRAWHAVSSSAAEAFFARGGSLFSYFERPEFAALWQQETVGERHQTYLTEMVRKIDCRGLSVLDVGCGFGRWHAAWAASRLTVGMDCSDEMLRRAATVVGQAPLALCRGDARHLPFSAGRFDVIIALQLTMHLAEPLAVLEELGGLLDKRGVIWTDFTCTDRKLSTPHLQESLLTRVFNEDKLFGALRRIGLDVRNFWRFREQHDHYWLALELVRPN